MALNLTQDQVHREKLSQLIPKPKAKNATGKNRPTIVSIEKDKKTPRWKWAKKIEDYTSEDKKKVLQKVLEIQAKTTFKNHFYRWGGRERCSSN